MKISTTFITILLLLFISSAYATDPENGHPTKFHGYDFHIEKKLNYDSLYAAASDMKNNPKASALIDNCIKAYGGINHLTQLNSFKIIYKEITDNIESMKTITKLYQKDLKHKNVNTSPVNQTKIRIINGNKGWYQTGTLTGELTPRQYKNELFSFYAASAPAIMQSNFFSEIKYGTRTDDSLEYIYMLKPDTMMFILGIDPKDYFIKYIEGVIYKDSNSYVTINRLSNIQKSKNYYFPQNITYISMGMEVGNYKLSEVEINPTFKEEDFLITHE